MKGSKCTYLNKLFLAKRVLNSRFENMDHKILLFGISREIVGGSELTLRLEEAKTVGGLLDALTQQYPEFGELKSIMVAVNNEYARSEHPLEEGDEIAIIPPVSGG